MDAGRIVFLEIRVFARRIRAALKEDVRQVVAVKVQTARFEYLQPQHLQIQIVVREHLFQQNGIVTEVQPLFHALVRSADITGNALAQPAAVNFVEVLSICQCVHV